MLPQGNDLLEAAFTVSRLLTYSYTIEAWIDSFVTWQHNLQKRVQAEQAVPVELLMGAELIAATAERAEGDDREQLTRCAEIVSDHAQPKRVELALSERVAQLMARHPDRRLRTEYAKVLQVGVERERSGFRRGMVVPSLL